jgi:hypothetical protein
MTAWNPHSLTGLSATGLLLLAVCTQSSAVARGGGLPKTDAPWNPEHIDSLPPEIRNPVLHMCSVRPNASHYFATYLDNARLIKLHFEHFDCEGRQTYRNAGSCLHEEFTLSGTHYRQTRNYYGRCDD